MLCSLININQLDAGDSNKPVDKAKILSQWPCERLTIPTKVATAAKAITTAATATTKRCYTMSISYFNYVL